MGLLMAANPVPGFAQLVGQEAELNRLEQRAEESMANGDSDGAAINIGKAALMAAVLAQENADENLKQLYQGAASLFRAQENTYRALALFDRAGGQLPVSSGTCQTLVLAAHQAHASRELLTRTSSFAVIAHAQQHERLRITAEEWEPMINDVYNEFGCHEEEIGKS